MFGSRFFIRVLCVASTFLNAKTHAKEKKKELNLNFLNIDFAFLEIYLSKRHVFKIKVPVANKVK